MCLRILLPGLFLALLACFPLMILKGSDTASFATEEWVGSWDSKSSQKPVTSNSPAGIPVPIDNFLQLAVSNLLKTSLVLYKKGSNGYQLIFIFRVFRISKMARKISEATTRNVNVF